MCEFLERTPINHKGKLGFHYLYVLKQQSTGREGVHSHYFVFDGAKLNVLVFEVFPRTDFEKFAPTFDQIFESFDEREARRPARLHSAGSRSRRLRPAPAQP